MGLRKLYKRLVNRWAISKSKELNIGLELDRIYLFPANKVGFANIFDKPFKFHDGKSFVSTYKELFQCDIYKFNPSNTSSTILDCGANMGLSVLYFSKNYPNHTIVAFEPDENIFNILKENVESFNLKNVILHQKAVWTRSETLKFYSDGGMGGRIDNAYRGQEPKIIEAVPLLDYLTDEIDFLKIDIEGAEDEVLKYCDENLKKAKHIFFEYHNNINNPQTLHELLELVKKNGFHYYIKESATRQKPFVDKTLICESFDMAINVFCYKQ
ncbi:MAG: Methyltransferase, FkbM family [Sphingobacteriales bacterium]|nr:Methyltransferase, FkbM family [Sphingobacteriales bacterium]